MVVGAERVLSLPAIAELASRIQWTTWKYEASKKGKKKDDKVPYIPGSSAKARINDPDTWGEFSVAWGETIKAPYEKRAHRDGVNFAPTFVDPYVGVDLDDCREAEGGIIEGWADEIVRTLDSYTEITPSGTGLRVFVKADKTRLPATGRKGERIEIYEKNHFLSVTGNHLDGTPTTIEERTEQLLSVHRAYFATKPFDLTTVEAPGHRGFDSRKMTDEELMQKMFASESGAEIRLLFGGDTSTFASHSDADWEMCRHLAFWTDGNVERMDRLFRRSLLMRKKWDERHGPDGSTYGQMTVGKAAARYAEGTPAGRTNGVAREYVPFSDLAVLLSRELPAPKIVIPGLIPTGLMIIAGKPKFGKSWLVLNILLASAAGGFALGRIECPRSKVWYLALEDTERRVQGRSKHILGDRPWPEGWFFYDTQFPKLDAGGIEQMDERLTENPDIRLVVVDVWKRVKPKAGKGDNAYDADYEAARGLKTLADKHDIAVVLIHHQNKLQVEDYVDSISGSLGFTGAADGYAVLVRKRGPGQGKTKKALFMGTHRDLEEDFEWALEWGPDLSCWQIVGDVEEIQQQEEEDTKSETVRIIREAGHPVTPSEFAIMAGGIPLGTAKSRLWRYAQAGSLVALKGGTYYASDGLHATRAADGPGA